MTGPAGPVGPSDPGMSGPAAPVGPSDPGMSRPGPGGSGGLTVCAPLRFEARAVRRGLTDAASGGGGGADFEVVATGMGARRSRAAAERLRASAAG
ncbi:MAG TPA: hypothetical protein VIZ00_10190, partial [Streptosporangiaceae bacterium]